MKKIIKAILRPSYHWILSISEKRYNNSIIRDLHYLKNTSKQNIFYLGATTHTNLGDLAQYCCIKNLLNQQYPNANIVEIGSDVIVYNQESFLSVFKQILKPEDLIFFQSGYTTQDLGGNHEEMHRTIIDHFPEAKIILLPQTVFFQHKENEERCAKSYNAGKHTIFLARDKVSYEKACEMFPEIKVKLYPDIVTSWIGTKSYNHKRKNVLFCLRNDGEKFYSNSEIKELKNKIKKNANIKTCDTTKRRFLNPLLCTFKKFHIRNKALKMIEKEIEDYSKYKVIVTDRYHGTIFSLIAGTPVVVIKTKDHKVTTGVDWFNGIYDERIVLAKDLNDAYILVKKILSSSSTEYKPLKPYFADKYYNDLNKTIEKEI